MWAEVAKPNLSLVGGMEGGGCLYSVEGEKEKKRKKKPGGCFTTALIPLGASSSLLLDEIDSCDYSCPASPPQEAVST